MVPSIKVLFLVKNSFNKSHWIFEQSHNFWMSLYKTLSNHFIWSSQNLMRGKEPIQLKPTFLWVGQRSLKASRAPPHWCAAGWVREVGPDPRAPNTDALPHLLDPSLPQPPSWYKRNLLKTVQHSARLTRSLSPCTYFIVFQSTFFHFSAFH